MKKIAIITVNYNRPDSSMRLLDSLSRAFYDEDKVDLIISVDKGKNQKIIIDCAERYKWNNGEKIIKKYDRKQGLRAHILQCGDYTQIYDAVIVLEDDIVVAENFYRYAKQMINYYEEDDRIAGISLYSFQVIQRAGRFFAPINNGYDVFLMQVAQSWGQCWTKEMWKGFMKWYNNNNEDVLLDEKIPYYITTWNNQSWLKYYNRYIIEMQKFFVYPYISLSTNNSEEGEHRNYIINDYQVPMLSGKMEYRIPHFDEAVKYDPFFERIGIESSIFKDIKGKKLLDLNGSRILYGDADILISTNILPYEIIKKIALKYRPIENNCLFPVEGEGIYLYNLHKKTRGKAKNQEYNVARYEVRAIHWRYTLKHGIVGLRRALKKRLWLND